MCSRWFVLSATLLVAAPAGAQEPWATDLAEEDAAAARAALPGGGTAALRATAPSSPSATGTAAYAAVTPAYCNPLLLRWALLSARPGTTVRVGACQVSASYLYVPDGVTLAGSGRGVSFLNVPGGVTYGVYLRAGAYGSRLTNLTVNSSGRSAVLSFGTGRATVDNVNLTIARGIGVGAQGLARLVTYNVNLTGAVTEQNAPFVSPDDPPTVISTHGLVGVNVAQAFAINTTANGFSNFGGLFAGSQVYWYGGGASGNVLANATVWAGYASLGNLDLCRAYRGTLPAGTYPVAAAFYSGAAAATQNLEVCENEGFGLYADGAGALTHAGLYAYDNAAPAVWAQGTEYLELTTSALAGNRVGGLVAYDTGFVSLDTVEIVGTDFGTLDANRPGAGDGVQLVGTAADLFDVTLLDSERIGFVADLAEGQTIDDLRFSGVAVDAPSYAMALGLIAQQAGLPLPYIEEGVARSQTQAQNDEAFIDFGAVLDLVGSDNPNPQMPKAEAVATGGLGVLLFPPQA